MKIKEEIEENKNKFLNRAAFSKLVEEKVLEIPGISYREVIVGLCNEIGIEIEKMSQLLNSPIVEKLRVEAQDLHFLPRSKKLPV